MITSKLTIAVAVLAAASMVAAPLLLGEQAFATDKKVIKKSITVSRDNVAANSNTQTGTISGQCTNAALLAGAQANAGCIAANANTVLVPGQTAIVADTSTNIINANQ